MNNYLLEIRTEEMPARFMLKIFNDLYLKTKNILEKNNLSYNFLYVTGTARRLVLIIEGLKKNKKNYIQEIRGPRISFCYDSLGNETKEFLSFIKKYNIKKNFLIKKNINKIDYIIYEKKTNNTQLKTLLKNNILQILNNISFSKSMRWGKCNKFFIRPIRSIISLYNNKLLPINYCDIKADIWTVGHRFLSNKKIIIKDNKKYFNLLRKNFVIVDHNERKKIIINNLLKKEKILNGKICEFSKNILIEENLFLVEYPTLFIGSFNKNYLKLPKEVIKINIEKYQKLFSVENKNKKVLPKFIGLRCGNEFGIEKIIKENKKVLNSRLKDAEFFFKEDRKKNLLSFKEKLNKVIFQEQIGTIGEKVDRIKLLSMYLGKKLFPEKIKYIEKTALLSKCDLETKMIGEFPELQGIIGSEYSSLDGESKLVSKGILEHYKPNFSKDSVSTIPTAIVVGIADKIDTIVGIMGIGEMPTGSQDPYCLRRLGIGIIRTIIENKIFISFEKLIEKNKIFFKCKLPYFNKKNILNFLNSRFKSILEESFSNYNLDFLLKNSFDDFFNCYLKIKALNNFEKNNLTSDLIKIFKRINNILKNEKNLFSDFDISLSKEKEELFLGNIILKLKNKFDLTIKNKNYQKSLIYLSQLKNPLDNFFDKIIILDKNLIIRKNRLSLLNIIKKMYDKVFVDIEFIYNKYRFK